MKLKILYISWLILVLALVFIKNGLSNDNITHGLLLLFLAAQMAVFYLFSEKISKRIKNSKRFFILYCVLSACVVEGLYMITSPVLPSLLITAKTAFAQDVKNYLIDLAFTVPAYVVIFNVIWKLISKYEYSVWEFVFLFSLGQALGDGSRTFLFQPGLLLLVPYIMLNYQAMNVAPFLYIKDSLKPAVSGKWKYIAPVVFIPLVYVACGVAVYTVAALLKIK